MCGGRVLRWRHRVNETRARRGKTVGNSRWNHVCQRVAMRCLLVLVLGSVLAIAQPQNEKIETLFEAHQEALTAGHYELATAKRNDLRSFIESTPVDAPEFADWVERVSAIYGGLDMHRDSRDILERALARVGKSGPAKARVKLLSLLATS